jgi:hypothetical protein
VAVAEMIAEALRRAGGREVHVEHTDLW